MTKHVTGTRKEWLAARLDLLEAEKELTRRSDELARGRQELPWVRVDKAYRFETDEGSASLADLFRGRSQLLVYHFMFGPDYTAGCPNCSAIADCFNGFVDPPCQPRCHPRSGLPGAAREAAGVQAADGLDFPWASSLGGDFNFDFNVSFTEEQQQSGGGEYNFEPVSKFFGQATELRQPEATGKPGPIPGLAASVGTDWPTYTREAPGMSAFAFEDGVVFHTYSTYARGLDVLWGMYQWLDRAPKGRNETGIPAPLWRRHDEYDTG